MIKLTQLDPDKVLPVKELNLSSNKEYPLSNQIEGHNGTVYQLEECGIEVDVEKLARVLQDKITLADIEEMQEGSCDCKNIAKVLSQSAGQFIKIVMVKP